LRHFYAGDWGGVRRLYEQDAAQTGEQVAKLWHLVSVVFGLAIDCFD
jgi:hypothetical protein